MKIKPFSAIRPVKEWASEVAALPYDVMTAEEAKQMVKAHPYSFLNIDKPEIYYPNDSQLSYMHAQCLLEEMILKGMFIQETCAFYIYELECESGHQYGLGCLVSADDYTKGVIKRHELTRIEKETDRVLHISYCKAHTGPVFLIEDDWEAFGDYLERYTRHHEPIYNFTSEDNVMHKVYIIKDEGVIAELIEEFGKVDEVYIADGHHRAAAAVQVAKEIGTSNPEANDFLAVIFPKKQLTVLAYHRMVKDESGYTKEEVLKRVCLCFVVTPLDTLCFYPSKPHEFGMHYQNEWYKLQLKPEVLTNMNEVEKLDVTILQNCVLEAIFGIYDFRTDPRIEFIPGNISKVQFDTYCQMEGQVVFTLYPTAISSLIDIANQGSVMPPKSTWFEPKLRSGLLIHKF